MTYFDEFKALSQFRGTTMSEQQEFLAQQAFDKYFNDAIDKVRGIIYNEVVYYDNQVLYDDNKTYSDVEYDFIIQHLIYGERFNDEKLLIVQNSVNVTIGSFVAWDNKIWLVTNQENRAIKTHKAYKITLCNNTISWKDNSGKSHTTACFIKDEGLGQQDDSRKLPMSVSKRVVKIQYNSNTEKIYQNQRFIFSKKHAFIVTEIDDFTQPNLPNGQQQGIITLKLERTQVMEKDDLQNNIAYNEYGVEQSAQNDVLFSKDKLTISQGSTESVTVYEYAVGVPTSTVFTFRIDGIDPSKYEIVQSTGNSISIKCLQYYFSGTLVAIKPNLTEYSIPIVLKSPI